MLYVCMYVYKTRCYMHVCMCNRCDVVCMYVCMYVCVKMRCYMHVRMCDRCDVVCMYVSVIVGMLYVGCMCNRYDVVCMSVRMYVYAACLYACVHVCMYHRWDFMRV